jgi:hypothetical protein
MFGIYSITKKMLPSICHLEFVIPLAFVPLAFVITAQHALVAAPPR